MDIGAILTEAWSLYTRFFVRFIVVAGVVFLGLGALSTIIEQSAGDGDAATVVAQVAALAVSMIGYFWIQGVLVILAADVRDGVADQSFGELFERVRPRLGSLILAGILAGLGIALGLLLLVVPGLYLLTRWSMIAPALLLEDLSAGESFARSHELVRDRAWSVFGLLLLLFAIGVVVGIVLLGVASGISGGFVTSWIASALLNTLVTPFSAIATTLVYFRLAGAARPRELVGESL